MMKMTMNTERIKIISACINHKTFCLRLSSNGPPIMRLKDYDMKDAGGAIVRLLNEQKFVWKISERGRDSSTSFRRVGERREEDGEWGMGSGEWGTENGIFKKTGNGEWGTENGIFFPHSLLPIPHSPFYSLGA